MTGPEKQDEDADLEEVLSIVSLLLCWIPPAASVMSASVLDDRVIA